MVIEYLDFLFFSANFDALYIFLKLLFFYILKFIGIVFCFSEDVSVGDGEGEMKLVLEEEKWLSKAEKLRQTSAKHYQPKKGRVKQIHLELNT